MPPGAPMYGAAAVVGRGREGRPAPLRGADGGEQHRLRRPPRLQQLRLLRLLRLPHPRQGRPGGAADQGDGHRPGRADGRDLRQPDRHRRAAGHRRRVHRRRTAPRTPWTPSWSSWRAGAIETPRLLLLSGLEHPALGPAPDGALPDDRRRALPDHAPAPAQGPRRHPRARRRHGAGRRARARPPPRPGCRGSAAAWSSTAAAGLPIMEARHSPWGRAARPGDARVEPPRAHVGLHHAGRGPALRRPTRST